NQFLESNTNNSSQSNINPNDDKQIPSFKEFLQVDMEEKAEGKFLEQLNNFKAEAINIKHISHLS
ncbi:18533_t:CDS:1, partial [Racocetra fulgida]